MHANLKFFRAYPRIPLYQQQGRVADGDGGMGRGGLGSWEATEQGQEKSGEKKGRLGWENGRSLLKQLTGERRLLIILTECVIC